MLRRVTLFLVLSIYMMASLGLFNFNLALLHQAVYQSYVEMAGTDELTELRFSEEEFANLNWTEKGREFMWQEKMFDVSSIEKIGEDYAVTCKHDEVESFVVSSLTDLKKGTSKNLPTKKRSRKDFSTKHFAQKILRTTPMEALCKIRRFEPVQKLEKVFDDVKAPPPKSLLFS